MKKKLFAAGSIIFGLVMFVIAIFVIRRELHGHSVHEILDAAASVPTYRLVLAFTFTILCHVILTGYDLLATRTLTHRLSTVSLMLNSFICHAMAASVGCTALTAGSLRCQYYLYKGMSPTEIVRIVTFAMLTFWLGFLTVGGAVFLFLPPDIPSIVHIPIMGLQLIGTVFLLVILAYVLLILTRRKPIVIYRWEIPVTRARVTIAQIVVSASEWIFGAAVLFALLPMQHHPAMYFHLLSFYFIAQVFGAASQVPSGLGVFEGVMLAFAPAAADPSRILASLLLYRLIFNVFPLAVAGASLGIRAVVRHKSGISRMLSA